jgi:hypothetical protein
MHGSYFQRERHERINQIEIRRKFHLSKDRFNQILKEKAETPVYPIFGSTFQDVKKRSLAFGLDLVGGMIKNKNSQPKAEKPEEKLPEPKQANEKPGGVIYNVGGNYYSDTPDGPAQYVKTESIVNGFLLEGEEKWIPANRSDDGIFTPKN